MVPSTSDDKTAVYDPHDYDEVPLDEGATISRSPLGATLSAPPAMVESAVPGPAPADPIPEIEDDGVYSVVSPREPPRSQEPISSFQSLFGFYCI